MDINLGSNWKEAIQSAYCAGYDAWQYSYAGIKDEAQELAEELGRRDAQHQLVNEGKDVVIHEDSDYRKFVWAIEDFYEEHMPQELYEQYQREEAVAEDLHSAFEAGAWDAIFGEDPDVETVSHFHE